MTGSLGQKMEEMATLKITPFLIVNPIIIIWMTVALVNVMRRGGFAMSMSHMFVTIILASAVFLIIDRLVVKRVNLGIMYVIEIVLLLISFKFFDAYLYG